MDSFTSHNPPPSPEQRRAQLQALAASLPHALWRGNALGAHATRGIATGHAALDAELPGRGWPPAMLTELLWAQQGAGEFRLLAPLLRSLTQAGKSVIMVAPPQRVFAPALAQMEIDIRQLLLIRSEQPADRLWAIEQVLKSASFGALLCWLPQARPEHLRRLQLAAGNAEGPAFIFRPTAARHESSPAPLRLLCAAESGGALAVEVFKRRGPVSGVRLRLPAQSPGLPAVITRAFARVLPATLPITVPSNAPAGLPHALDRALPAAAAAGPRVPTLA
jgi:hypothetical protein